MSVFLSKQRSCKKGPCSSDRKDNLKFDIQTDILVAVHCWNKLNLMYLASEPPEPITVSDLLSNKYFRFWWQLHLVGDTLLTLGICVDGKLLFFMDVGNLSSFPAQKETKVRKCGQGFTTDRQI